MKTPRPRRGSRAHGALHNELMASDPDYAARIEQMRQPSPCVSLATTFPVTPADYAAQRRHRESVRRSRKQPMVTRENRSMRKLANAGAMDPEGCTVAEMETVVDRYDLTADAVKAIMSNLWAFRLLGWFPGDTAYLNYAQVTDIVARNAERPKDTLSHIPHGFASKQDPEELAALRYGRGATWHSGYVPLLDSGRQATSA